MLVEHEEYTREGVSSLLQAWPEPNATADGMQRDQDVPRGLSSIVYLTASH